jgi:hypothetical protein
MLGWLAISVTPAKSHFTSKSRLRYRAGEIAIEELDMSTV